MITRATPSTRGRRAAALTLCFSITGLALSGCRPSAPAKSGDGPTAGSQQTAAAPSKSVPAIGGAGFNVLFVSVDTTRADALGCYGGTESKTPTIDRLAAEGARFVTCVAGAPLTLPSHSTMMTGAHTFVHGARDNGVFVLSEPNTTLAEIFKSHGYATHAEVAAGVLNARYGLNQGFDTYGDLSAVNVERPKIRVVREAPLGLQAETEPKFDLSSEIDETERDRSAEEVANAGIEHLRRLAQDERPFFLFLHFFDPHWPWMPPPRFSGFKHPYFGEIAYFDEQFGRIIDELKSLGLAEKTLVVLTSDHGEGRGQHGEMTHSTFVYDSTLLVPLILWCPGQIPSGTVVEQQVRLIDLAPTVLAFAGLSEELTPQMTGVSLIPTLFGGGSGDELVAYSDTMVPKTMHGYSPLRALRTEKWKYILAPKSELYDLDSDPMELFNLASAQPALADEMKERMRDLIADAPPPPAGTRGSPKEVTEAERRMMESLGYIASVEDLAAEFDAAASELDAFEPVGANPRDRVEVIDLLACGLGCFRSGLYEESIEIWERFVELEPESATGTSHLALAYMATGRTEQAIKMFQRTLELRPDAAEEHRQLGTLLLIEQEYDEALKHFRAAAEYNPDDYVAHLNVSKILMSTGDTDGALEAINTAAGLAPKESRVHFQKGMVLRVAKRFDEALASLDEAIQLDPKFVKAQLQYAGTLLDMGRSDDAIGFLKHSIEAYPTSATLYHGVAECHVARKEPELAGPFFEKVIELEPDNAQARRSYAANLAAQGRNDEAAATYQKAIELDPESGLARLRLASLLLSEGRRDEALRVMRECVESKPRESLAYAQAAAFMFDINEPAAAIAALRAGLGAAPNNVAIANDLAWALATNPDPAYRNGAEALSIIEPAVKATKAANAQVLDTFAAALAEVGRFDDAVKAADRAIALAENAGNADLAGRMGARRTLYAGAKPYHEPAASSTTLPVGSTE